MSKLPPELLGCSRRSDARATEAELADSRRRLRALTAELALAEERERQRISLGLHDQVGQVLGVARVKLGQALAADPSAEVADKVAEARRLVDLAIREVRALTFELSSPLLHELGLGPALESLAERMTQRYGIPCRFEAAASRSPTANAANAEVTLYSVARELLWNVVKHAGAGESELAIRHREGRIAITVSDDGVGFDAAGAFAPPTVEGGFGLFKARERLEYLGGSLEIDSAPGRGTRVVASCPLGGGRRKERG